MLTSYIVIMLLCSFIQIRNIMVLEILEDMNWNGHSFETDYIEQMKSVFFPIYWHMWTKKQFIALARKRIAKEQEQKGVK